MKRLIFPSLHNGAFPISYELGVAMLLAWVGMSLHYVGEIAGRYPSNYWIWKLIDEHDWEHIIPWYAVTAATLICLGLLRVVCGCSDGRIMRAAGLMMGAALFAFIALGHLTITFYSVAGAPYLFLAWRFLELSIFYVRKP